MHFVQTFHYLKSKGAKIGCGYVTYVFKNSKDEIQLVQTILLFIKADFSA